MNTIANLTKTILNFLMPDGRDSHKPAPALEINNRVVSRRHRH